MIMKKSFGQSKMILAALLLALGLWAFGGTGVAQAQEGFIGEIRIFAGNFAPRSWALCDGQLLPINNYQALFSILGTTYGGDGRTTFALPDLRGRFAMHPGTGAGLSQRRLGEKGGTETVLLTVGQMPQHNHTAVVNAQSLEGDATIPDAGYWAKSGQGDPDYHSSADTTMNAGAVVVGNSGGNQAHNNMPPYQCVNYIICLYGVYPSRD